MKTLEMSRKPSNTKILKIFLIGSNSQIPNNLTSRTPMSILSVDAAQCYDRVNHVIVSLMWLALIGLVGPIKVFSTVYKL